MIDSLWMPGLAVLAAGLGFGWWAARRAGRGAAGKPGATQAADRTLAIADLEARRDQIYAHLRGEEGGALSDADRRELELSAARTLRQLEELGQKGSRAAARRGAKAAAGAAEQGMAKSPPPTARGGGLAARHPLVAGFLLGSGMVAVVGLLFYWAIRDARPTEAPSGGPQAAPVAGGLSPDEAHVGLDDLPITLRVELDALNERIAAGDADLRARRERALFLLGIERYVEAFEDSKVLLAADPQDIDGLYVQGVVRLTMGQDELALQLFDQVIGLFPDHVQALVWRGILLFRSGDREGALAAWRRGLDAAGGSQPEIEELIRAAEQGPPPPSPSPPPTRSASPPAPASPPATSAVAPDAFGLRVTIAEGAFPPPGGILFVSLRPADGGPPVAVKRVDRVSRFPLDLVIDAADSMMGQALPPNGILRVRLDADGSASTRSPDDLEAEVAVTQGSSAEVVLGSG